MKKIKVLKKYHARFCELVVLSSFNGQEVHHFGQLRHISPLKVSFLEIDFLDEKLQMYSDKLSLNKYQVIAIKSIRELSNDEFLLEIAKFQICKNFKNFFDLYTTKLIKS